VEGIVRGLLLEKGFQFATVTHQITELPGAPKLVHLTFQLDEGPRVKVHTVTFSGNHTVSTRVLRSQLKTNKPRPWWRPKFLGGASTFQEAKFDEDADVLQQYYRDHGYVTASIGVPELRPVEEKASDAETGLAGWVCRMPIVSRVCGRTGPNKTRWVDLHVPVTEGERYRVGDLTVAGNVAVKSDALRPLFVFKEGEYYSEKRIRKGLEKARELYGSGGYYEFTGYPDVKPRDRQFAEQLEAPESLRAPDPAPTAAPTVDITMRFQEGQQFFVNRLSFSGNTTTHDNVIRREVALLEGGVFNTEALKYTVKRLNQLGYFKPIEDQKGIKVEKTPGQADRVDVALKVEEQNRNSVTFGAGVSQYEGVFGNLSYTTSNLLGRGESLTLTLQKGSRSNIRQIGISEPYLFDRPISASAELYSRKTDYYSANTSTFSNSSVVGYSEVRQGSAWAIGRPLKRFMHGYLNYTYEITDIAISDEFLAATGTSSTAGTPLFNSALDKGRHIDSRICAQLQLQHRRQPDHVALRDADLGKCAAGEPSAAGLLRLREAGSRARVVRADQPANRFRPARADRHAPYVRDDDRGAVLPALFPGRRDADPWRRHPDRRSARRVESRARRQQVSALQRRVLRRSIRPGPSAGVP
jgi:outer membrane protein insertion porin family